MHLVFYVQDVIQLLMLIYVKSFFRASQNQGPLSNLSLVCKAWSAASSEPFFLSCLETIPQAALWKLQRLKSIEFGSNRQMLEALMSQKLNAENFMMILKKAQDFETLELLAPLVPPCYVRRKSVKSTRKDAFLLGVLTDQLEDAENFLPCFYESYRPIKLSHEWVQAVLLHSTQPFDFNNPLGLYDAFCTYNTLNSWGMTALPMSKANLLLIKLVILEDHYESKSSNWIIIHFQKVIKRLFKNDQFALCCELFGLMARFRDPKGVSLLSKVLLPVYFWAVLSESKSFFYSVRKSGRIFDHNCELISCTSKEFQESISLMQKESKRTYLSTNWLDEMDWSEGILLAQMWKFDARRISVTLEKLIDREDGLKRRLYACLHDLIVESIDG